MKHQRTLLATSVVATFGGGIVAADMAFAGPVVPGVYDLVVLTTPTAGYVYQVGTDGAWNSSFSFGIPSPITGTSQGMSDNGVNLTDGDGAGTASRAFGSSIAGDGYAGILGITVSGTGAVTVSSFAKDLIKGTAGGDFAQEGGDLTAYSGSVNLATGAMNLVTGNFASGAGRRGAIDLNALGDPCGGGSAVDEFCDTPWNKDDVGLNTGYATFTTGTASLDTSSINGAVLSNIGDVNGDSTEDYNAVLVSGGDVGNAWASFSGSDYFEVWSINLLYKSGVAVADAGSATTNIATVIDVLGNDFGKSPLVVSNIASTPTNGTAVVSNGGADVTYTSNPGFTGADTFTYTLTDGFGKTAVGQVSVTVASNPVIADNDLANIKQDVTTAINVADGDVTNAPGATIDPASVVVGVTTAQGATLTNNGDGTVTYNPLPDFVGPDTFTYTIEDDQNNVSNVATVTVNVAAGPLTNQGTYANGTLAASVSATDGVITSADIGVPDSSVATSCQGGCFDFQVTGAANPAVIVLPPLSSSVSVTTAAASRYRKLNGGVWGDFDTSQGDSVASAPKSVRGGCPAPSDPSWKQWNGAIATTANNQDECIRLTIMDTGQNDGDANVGTVADPGGVGTTTTAKSASGTVTTFTKNAGSGCSLRADESGPAGRADWWVLGAFVGMLGWLRRRIGKPVSASHK